MDETVRVEFDPPRTCQETEKAWLLSAGGEECLILPKSQTNELVRDGETVQAAIVSRWLAEKEGFIVSSTSSFQGEEKEDDSMTRDDWVMLGLTMACVIRGDTNSDAVWNVGVLMRKLRGEE